MDMMKAGTLAAVLLAANISWASPQPVAKNAADQKGVGVYAALGSSGGANTLAVDCACGGGGHCNGSCR